MRVVFAGHFAAGLQHQRKHRTAAFLVASEPRFAKRLEVLGKLLHHLFILALRPLALPIEKVLPANLQCGQTTPIARALFGCRPSLAKTGSSALWESTVGIPQLLQRKTKHMFFIIPRNPDSAQALATIILFQSSFTADGAVLSDAIRKSFAFPAMLILCFAIAFSSDGFAQNDGTAADHGPIVVLITIDGFPARALDDPLLPMPALRALEASGAHAKTMQPFEPHRDLAEPYKPDYGGRCERASRDGQWPDYLSREWRSPENRTLGSQKTLWFTRKPSMTRPLMPA